MSGFLYDAFISYSHKDQDWVRDVLLPRLENEQLKICIDYRDFRIGVPNMINMERGVEQSRKILFVFTPDWVSSEWSKFEALMIHSEDPNNVQVRMLPLYVRPCILPLRLKHLNYIDFTTTSVSLQSKIQRLVAAIRDHTPQAPIAVANPIVVETAPPLPASEAPWQAGDDIHLQNSSYMLLSPVYTSTAADGFRYQYCQAQDLANERKVWLKQVCILRPTRIAQSQLQALAEESQILTSLTEQGLRPFPHLYKDYREQKRFTLAYALPAGTQSWQAMFGSSRQVPDVYRVRLLLKQVPALCTQLAMLHAKHYAHRALTPENILVQESQLSLAFLRDLGLATFPRIAGEARSPYQAPEQEQLDISRKSNQPGSQIDIYRLGAILYHLLTGQLPVAPAGLHPPPPGAWNANLPAELDAVILKAIQPAGQERWQNILEFSKELQKASQKINTTR